MHKAKRWPGFFLLGNPIPVFHHILRARRMGQSKVMRLYFSCSKCKRTITREWPDGKKLPAEFQVICFKRAGVGCGQWSGWLSPSKASRTRPR